MSDDEYEEFEDVWCVNATDKAVKVAGIESASGASMWIPKSVLHDDSEVYMVGDRGTLRVHTWWARKENLI